jgi:CBS domain-containing protein
MYFRYSLVAVENAEKMKLTMSVIPGLDSHRPELAHRQLPIVDRDVTILDASKLMRKTGISEVLVMGQSDGMRLPLGVISATDIVTRVIAMELNPAVLTMGDIVWCGPGHAGNE